MVVLREVVECRLSNRIRWKESLREKNKRTENEG